MRGKCTRARACECFSLAPARSTHIKLTMQQRCAKKLNAIYVFSYFCALPYRRHTQREKIAREGQSCAPIKPQKPPLRSNLVSRIRDAKEHTEKAKMSTDIRQIYYHQFICPSVHHPVTGLFFLCVCAAAAACVRIVAYAQQQQHLKKSKCQTSSFCAAVAAADTTLYTPLYIFILCGNSILYKFSGLHKSKAMRTSFYCGDTCAIYS